MSNNTDNQDNNQPMSYPEIENFEDLQISSQIIKGIFILTAI